MAFGVWSLKPRSGGEFPERNSVIAQPYSLSRILRCASTSWEQSRLFEQVRRLRFPPLRLLLQRTVSLACKRLNVHSPDAKSA